MILAENESDNEVENFFKHLKIKNNNLLSEEEESTLRVVKDSSKLLTKAP
jgi:hypothetical protein